MAITATNIHFRKATTSGAAGNSTAPGAAGTSLGKYITNADISDATLNNLFPDVTGDENAASNVDYQCMFVYNDHATLSWLAPVAWISAEVSNGTSVAYWWDSTAASVVTSASAQALIIANKNTMPTGFTACTYTDKASAKAGTGATTDIAATYCKALWIRRSAANNAAVDNDGATIRVEGDTAA